jgi:hypothetical protein
MSCFPAKVMATLVLSVLLFLLVGDILATSASLPYGNNSFLYMTPFLIIYIYDRSFLTCYDHSFA